MTGSKGARDGQPKRRIRGVWTAASAGHAVDVQPSNGAYQVVGERSGVSPVCVRHRVGIDGARCGRHAGVTWSGGILVVIAAHAEAKPVVVPVVRARIRQTRKAVARGYG